MKKRIFSLTTLPHICRRPPGRPDRRGGLRMPDTSFPRTDVQEYRKEVLDYLHSCEHLLAAAALPGNPPLSKEERGVITRYAVEILTAVTPKATGK